MLSHLSVNNSYGKSLLELTISLAIISFISLIASVSSSFISGDKIGSYSKELYGDLIKLRYSSMTHGSDKNIPNMRGYGIRFQDTNAYYLFRIDDQNQDFFYSGTNEEASLVGETSVRKKELPRSVQLQVKEKGELINPHNNVVIYDHHGIPRQPSGGFQMMTLVIESSNDIEARKKCISITFTRIREGLWDGQDCIEQ